MKSGRYQTYPHIQDSEISWLSEIPVHWQLKRFKNLFRIRKRIAGKLGFAILSITQRGIKTKDITSGEGQLSMDYSKYQLVNPGDFAMNHMDLLTGFVDISNFKGVTSPDYRVFTLEDQQSDKRYFLYLLQFCYIGKIFYPLGQGAAQVGRWRLPAEAFNEFVSPVPPLDEQIKIASFLDTEIEKIDSLIEKQQQLIKLLKEKRQAVISRAVTKGLDSNVKMKDSSVEWLGEVPEHWAVTQLRYISTLIDGDRSSAYPNESDLVDDGIPFVSSKNIVDFKLTKRNLNYITKEKFDSLGRGKLQDGDLVITVRGTIGHVAIFDKDVIGAHTGFINAQMMIIRPQAGLTRYIQRCSESQFWQKQLDVASYGATVKQLSNYVMGNLVIALPPCNEMESLLNQLDKTCYSIELLINKAKTAIHLMYERRTALISAAVTGKIDVRNWKPDKRQNAA